MNLQIKYYTLIFALFASQANAQKKDSIDVLIKHAQFSKVQTQLLYASPFVLANAPNKSTMGTAAAQFKNETGGFRQAQQPHTETLVSMGTEGMHGFAKNIWVTGGFTYERGWHDSMAFTQRFHWNDPSPYYLYAAKAGDWISEAYKLQGSIALPISKQWSAGVAAHYFAADYARLIDPRPQVNYFQLQTRPSVHYKSNAHSFGFFGLLGYSHNSMNTTNYNDLNDNKPDYKLYLNEGYSQHGEEKELSALSQFRTHTGVGIEYFWQPPESKHSLYASLHYDNMQEENFNLLPNSNNKKVHGTFNLFAYNWQFLHTWKINRAARLETHFKGNMQKGRDYNYRLLGNDFTFYGIDYLLESNYILANQTDYLGQAGLYVQYHNEQRKDGNFLIDADYKRMTIGLQTQIRSFWTKRIFSDIRIGASYLFNMNSSLLSGLASTDREPFTRGVIYHDKEYFSANAFAVETQLTLHLKIDKNWMNVFVKTYLQKQSSEQIEFANALTHPNGKRAAVEFGLGIIF
jgi:hypothetical protein